VAAEIRVQHIILGLSYTTEGVNPTAWHYGDPRYYADVLARFSGEVDLDIGYKLLDLRSLAGHTVLRRIRTIQLPLYMAEYRESEIRDTLSRELGWVYGGHHHFDCAYKPFVTHIQANKFNADLRKVSLSAQVRTGEMTRDEALTIVSDPPRISPQQLDYCLGRLEMSESDLQRILDNPKRSYRDYRSYHSIALKFKAPLRVMSRLGIVPETTYEKLFET
jgi:hypothetical protein